MGAWTQSCTGYSNSAIVQDWAPEQDLVISEHKAKEVWPMCWDCQLHSWVARRASGHWTWPILTIDPPGPFPPVAWGWLGTNCSRHVFRAWHCYPCLYSRRGHAIQGLLDGWCYILDSPNTPGHHQMVPPFSKHHWVGGHTLNISGMNAIKK